MEHVDVPGDPLAAEELVQCDSAGNVTLTGSDALIG